MKFYLDFEATQCSNRIISIGCVDENGDKFSTLVKPVNGDKVGRIVTELTGITDDMVAVGAAADQAFMDFMAWFLERETGLPQFFSYGNDDHFIKATVKYMTNPITIMFANSICGTLVDYSKIASKLVSRKQIGLRALVAMIEKDEEVIQHHDALEDAEWLRLVENKLPNTPVSLPQISQQAKAPKQTPKKVVYKGPFPELSFNNMKKEPEEIQAWGQIPKERHALDIGGNGSIDNWVIRGRRDNKVIYFADYETAIYWATRMIRKMSIKQASTNQKTWSSIKKSVQQGNLWHGIQWEIKEMEKE